MHMDISQESACIEIFRENAKRPSRGHRFVRARAIEMHMSMSLESLEPFYVVIYKKCQMPLRGTSFCASLRRRNGHGHFTRAILCGNLRENAGRFRYHLD